MNQMIIGAGVSKKTVDGQLSAENCYNLYADEKDLPHLRETPRMTSVGKNFFNCSHIGLHLFI
jgi:hypothetical protein